AVAREDALRPNQTGRIEDRARPARIALEHRPGLDEDMVLPRLYRQQVRVFVRDLDGELLQKLAVEIPNEHTDLLTVKARQVRVFVRDLDGKLLRSSPAVA